MLIRLISYHKSFNHVILRRIHWDCNKQDESRHRLRKILIYNRRYYIIAPYNTVFRKQNIVRVLTCMMKKTILLKKFHVWRLDEPIYLCRKCCDNTASNNNYKPTYSFECYWCDKDDEPCYRVVGSVVQYTKTLPINE